MDQLLADRLKALAHPARLEILRVLAARGTCVCGKVVEVMPLAQATVSQHLKALKEAGLIRGRIDGCNSCYCLDPQTITDLREALDEFLGVPVETAAVQSELSRAAVGLKSQIEEGDK